MPLSLIKDVRSQLTRLISKDPKTAVQNPRTSKPDITPDAIMSRIALITKVKSPRVRTVMGNVKRNNMGRKKAFRIPRIAAANSAEEKPLT